MDRRTFLSASALGLAASQCGITHGAQFEDAECKVHKHDIVIAGGGPAGCAASLAARRLGATVALLEQHPCFGGVWTMGSLAILIDSHNKTGLMREITTKLRKDRHLHDFYNDPEKKVYNVEAMKLLLDDLLVDSGADLRLHTFVADVEKTGDRITSLVTASKSGFEKWEAKVFLDCTGDGDVGALAGCDFHMGRESDGHRQPGTTYGLVGGWEGEFPKRKEMMAIFEKAGKELPYQGIYIFVQDGMHNMGYLMPSHVYGLDPTDADSLTRCEIEGRRQVRYVVDVLKKHGGPKFKNFFLAATAPSIGIREGRRIVGKYYLTIDDLEKGRTFEDGICNVEMPVDIHHVTKKTGTGLENIWTKPYQVPFRCLQPKGCENLLTAGRCISGSFLAHGSYRVTGDSVPIGEAAGIAAAMAVEKDVAAQDLVGAEVRDRVDRFRAEFAG
jgi:FAD-dependent oxidoreductase family protein